MNASIRGISYYLPEKTLSNQELSIEFPEWSVDKITDKIGIEKRHIASESETSVDLAVNSAVKLFEEYDVDKSSIDYVILCTQSPDYFLPTSACLVHERLGLSKSTGALDINQGCSGYVYGLSLAKGLVSSGICNNVLLITSETYSKYIHHSDKSNRAIFGDAAAASLISTTGLLDIGDFIFGSDGSGSRDLIVKNGGARNKLSMDTNYNPDDYLYMNGSNVFNFTLKSVPLLIENVLNKNKLDKEDIDYFVFHQANSFMLNTMRRLCKIEKNKFHNDMKRTGNTVSSTIPIVLKDKIFDADDKILLAGFGVGYSWAGCILEKN
ncbi:ketoacyl-ACP synthase III [Aquimarina addita]|uniref:Ketoacyl-ACP synthase III n=1 Tax=Aquimarina addita TaxID=870485 RepID=A0ABP6ULQ9_9FLAO